jgi:hypothetical protein
MLTINNGTLSVDNLLNRDSYLQFQSEGDGSDSTTTTLTISFDATTTVSRIGLLNHNWKKFNIYYNGVTANAFAVSGLTTTTQFTTNSATSIYFTTTPVGCTSVTIDITETITANQEKAIGYLAISDELLEFERIPAANGYKISLDPEQIVHNLSDGGTRTHTISQKWLTDIKFKYITESFKNDLYEVWSLRDEFMFVPFPTTSSWDGVLYECVWIGAFDFYNYTDNALQAGFSGTIKLRETAW